MATRAVSTVVTYRAWDTSANAAKTGDVANHTLKWIKDGTAASPTNSPSEVDATNAPGVYKLTLTSTETDCTFGVLAGKSGTANISIFGVQVSFEYVPTSATTFGAYIGNATAALAVDASGRVDAGKINGVSTSSVTTINANVGTTQPVNFTGTGASALAKSDMVDIAGAAVSTSSAQLGVNVVNWKGSAAAAMTGDAYARLGAPAGASVSADVAAVKTDTAAIKLKTDNLPADPADASDVAAAFTSLQSHGDGAWATATGFAVAGDSMDITSINGDATSAANLAKTTRAIARGTVTTGASTTSIPTSAFSPAGSAADQFKGRIITFDADTTTAALRGQSTDITASSASATPTLTVTALTSTPASGDTFSVT